MYALQARQYKEGSPDVVTSTLRVFDLDVDALLDSWAILSFVTPYIAFQYNVNLETLSAPILVSTLVGDPVIATWVYRTCPYTASPKFTSVDLVEIEMVDFNVILSMDHTHVITQSIVELGLLFFSFQMNQS